MSQTGPSDPDAHAARRLRAVRRTAVLCAVTFFAMVGAAFASVPLYRAFCQATGFDGATRQATAAPDKAIARTVVVRFDANVNGLPWDFKAEQTAQTVHIGATGLAFFKVTNTSDKAMTGRAIYNVVPETAGPYFQKLECFCFKDQTLKPGQSADFPVVYFIDPRFATDFETRGKTEVTLSYTFFPAINGAAKSAKSDPALGGTPRAGL